MKNKKKLIVYQQFHSSQVLVSFFSNWRSQTLHTQFNMKSYKTFKSQREERKKIIPLGGQVLLERIRKNYITVLVEEIIPCGWSRWKIEVLVKPNDFLGFGGASRFWCQRVCGSTFLCVGMRKWKRWWFFFFLEGR